MSEETSASTEEVSASTDEIRGQMAQISTMVRDLDALADELHRMIARFKLRPGSKATSAAVAARERLRVVTR